MEYVKSAFASILENKGRSFLTMLGIIIGIASVITILAIGNGMKASVGGRLGDMQASSLTITINAKKTDKTLTGAEIRQVGEQVPQIYGASPSMTAYCEFSARYKPSGSMRGGNENMRYLKKDDLIAGRFFDETQAESADPVAVIDQASSAALFGTTDGLGKVFTVTVGATSRELTVVGILKSKEEEVKETLRANTAENGFNYITVYVPYTLLSQAFGMQGEHFGSMEIYPHPNEQDAATLTTKRITENLLGIRGQGAVQVQSFGSMLETYNKVLNIVTYVVAFIAAISLIVGGIGVMNIMTVSVRERTREIGIRKALGARTGSVLAQFLVESALITLIGGLVGMGTGYLLAFVVSKFMPFPPVIEISDVIMVVSISTSIGLFFGIYPAYRASKMNPIEALRYE